MTNATTATKDKNEVIILKHSLKTIIPVDMLIARVLNNTKDYPENDFPCEGASLAGKFFFVSKKENIYFSVTENGAETRKITQDQFIKEYNEAIAEAIKQDEELYKEKRNEWAKSGGHYMEVCGFRGGGFYRRCQVMTFWINKPPKYIHCVDPETGEDFVAAQRMGAWMKVPVSDLMRIINGED